LELIKHAHIKVQQEAAFGQVWIYRGDNFGQPLGAPDDWEAKQEDSPVKKEEQAESQGVAWSAQDEPPVGTPPDEFTVRQQTPTNEEENA
jgi:hypothetical protein